jgi:hypothetical protein
MAVEVEREREREREREIEPNLAMSRQGIFRLSISQQTTKIWKFQMTKMNLDKLYQQDGC